MKTNDAECSRELIPDRILLLFILVCFVLCYDVLCLSSARNGDKARRRIRVRFLFKVSYICNNVQTVFSGVCAQCALCLSLWCEMDVIRSIFFICRNAPERSSGHGGCCERQEGRVVSFIVLSVNGCRCFVLSAFLYNFVAGGEFLFPCLLNRLKFILMSRRTSPTQHVVVIDPHRVTPSYIYSHASLVQGSVELLTDLPSWYARRSVRLRMLRCGVWVVRRLWRGAFHGLTAEQLLLSRWLRHRHTTVVLSEFGTSAGLSPCRCRRGAVLPRHGRHAARCGAPLPRALRPSLCLCPLRALRLAPPCRASPAHGMPRAGCERALSAVTVLL